MDYYDAISLGYDSLYGQEQLEKFNELRDLIPKEGLILDLGCGTGFITEKLGNAIGVDYSFGMLELCPNDLIAVCADISNLPFKDSSFDFVFSLTALQDLNDCKSAVLEIKRVLKPNGRILLSVLNKNKIKTIEKELKKNFKNIKIKKAKNDLAFFTQ